MSQGGPSPEGPVADFFATLRHMRVRAGDPSLRDIARATEQLSHDTVSRTLTGPALPRWANVDAVVRALGGDPDAVKPLWLAARVAGEPPPVGDEYVVESHAGAVSLSVPDDLLPEPAGIRVVLVEDHPLFRYGLRMVLEEAGFPVVAEAANGAEALTVVGEQRPDVVVMDLRMPEVSGVEATARLVQEDPSIRILVLTMFADTDSIRNAIRAGARGYLLKEAGPEEIVRAIRQVAAGVPVFTADVTASMLTHYREVSGQPDDAPQLSPREEAIVRLVAADRSRRDIATELAISIRTVDSTLFRVYRKLGVHSRAGLVRYAIEHDLAE